MLEGRREIFIVAVSVILVLILLRYTNFTKQNSDITSVQGPTLDEVLNADKRLISVVKSQHNLLTELKNSIGSVQDYNVQKSSASQKTLAEMKIELGEILKKIDVISNAGNKVGETKSPSVESIDSKAILPVKKEDNEKHIRTRELEKLKLDLEDVIPLKMPDPSTMSERWIVVTSIFAPTEDIKKLASIPGWKLVVVGDKKTPKDWHHKGVVFLGVEEQHNLGFETVKYLKYGVYQRKNMGFLYAIQHGAKYIYDTDDDNHPYGGSISNFDEMLTNKSYLMYNGNQHFYNTFEHFGQSTLWPRGYPLDMIDKPPVRKYKKCKNVRPLVQQGVVDGDPDLDAIQRLTRKDSSVKFVVYFDIKAPPVVLPPRSFAPYNTQNTFHHYDAFFSLMLPQTVTFRVNDIWRSYITQRLLWDIGGHLAYFPPNAYQDRTPHDFLQDFYEEDDLYRLTNPLAKLLLEWKSTKTNMPERHFEVVKEMYRKDILGALDVRLARAWVRDLKRINYKPPQMQPSNAACESTDTVFTPNEMPTLFNRIGQKTVNVVEIAKKLPDTKERERDAKFEKKADS